MVERLENFDIANYYDDMLEHVEMARNTLEADADAGDPVDGEHAELVGALDALTKLMTLILQDAGVDVPGAPPPTDSCEDSV